MMAIVVEIKGNLAAVLLEDGQIGQIPNSKYQLGQVLDVEDIVELH